jgi:hypothetical protein
MRGFQWKRNDRQYWNGDGFSAIVPCLRCLGQ